MIIAIDPGPLNSAILAMDGARIVSAEILENSSALAFVQVQAECVRRGHIGSHLAIEMIASYGMPVGAEVFETCVWIGRFIQAWQPCKWAYVYRKDVKLHLCGTPAAKDANVRQAIIDRYGGPDALRAAKKATRKRPGIEVGALYGIKADLWAALGVALTYQAK